MITLTETESEALGLRFIGHGTDGSDGLPPGIHLRWSFPSALGFPPNGITLSRAVTAGGGAMICPVPLPPVTPNPPPNITPLQQGSWTQYFYCTFPCAASRMELTLQLAGGSNIYVQLYKGSEVYEPWHIIGHPPGPKLFPFVTEKITAVLVYGNGLTVNQLCYNCCNDNAQWQAVGLINQSDLPSGLSAPGLAAYYGITDEDYAVALKRLGALPADRPISPADWAELYPVVDQVAQIDGFGMPVGWSVPAGMGSGGPDVPNARIPSAELLRTSMLNGKIAAALGTAFIDAGVVAGNLYQYRLEAQYPPTHLADLSLQYTFDAIAPTDVLYSDQAYGLIMFHNLSMPSIVTVPSVNFKVRQGLAYTNSTVATTRILVGGHVKEMQLFLTFTSANVTVLATVDNGGGPVVVNSVHAGPEAVVKVSAGKILEVRLVGTGMVMYRVHCDERRLVDLKIVATLCGLKKEAPLMPVIPEGLVADQVPVPPAFDEAKTLATRYLAGLGWKTWLNPNLRQIPQAPIGYNVLFQTGGAPYVKANIAGPVYLTQSLLKPYTPPAGWPPKRPHYLHALNSRATYSYKVTALDIWGRESPPTLPVSLLIQAATPPPPVNFKAKFLDYSTVQPDGTSIDPHLTQDEVAWLGVNMVDALHLTWQWTPTEDVICPAVDHFKVHFQPGWLNLFKGKVTSSATTETVANDAALGLGSADYEKYPALEGVASFSTYRFGVELENSIPANGFQMCLLKQGNLNFLVVKNTAGTTPDIWVMVPDARVGGEIVTNKKFTIMLVPGSSAFVDYADAANWTDVSISATVNYGAGTLDSGGNMNYELYIGSPAFPSPAFTADEQHPMRYAQLAASTVNVDSLQGAVGTPAAVMAVCRIAPTALGGSSIDYGTGSATPPDAHGKSTYYYRWLKQGLGMRYFVYRALDDTLIRTDFALGRAKEDYEEIADFYSVGYDSGTFDLGSLSAYDALNFNQLYVVANMPGNEAAFTRMHKEAIAEDNADYANRITEAPAIGSSVPTADGNYLLFEDNGLSGTGDNYYFYRIRTVDSAGNLSAYSPTTVPILVPQVIPAARPSISSITGGENEIVVAWNQKTLEAIVGYNVYRTADSTQAGDWRRMTLLLANETDTYTLEAGPEVVLSFTDTAVVARVPYYYGVVAVTLDDNGHLNRSAMSVVRSGQAYDLAAPEAPAWDEEHSGWVYVDDNGTIFEWEDDLSSAVNPVAVVRLVWEHNSNDYSISRSASGSSETIIVLGWGEGAEYDSGHRYMLDEDGSAGTWTYSISGRSAAGIISGSTSEVSITQ
jgi:hypothetical protein